MHLKYLRSKCRSSRINAPFLDPKIKENMVYFRCRLLGQGLKQLEVGQSVAKVAPEEEVSSLENFLPTFRLIYGLGLRINNANNERNLKALSGFSERFQTRITAPFPCETNNSRSPTRPDSVHRLRPGDIDVIGAIGDSLTAGYGLLATNVAEVAIPFRGKAFSGGGDDTWRESMTLPNILKVFNPNLVGYSLGNSLTVQRSSQFNVAVGGAVSKNTPYMTKILLKRITADKRVDLEKDWKMVTYLIGANDFCSEMCYERDPRSVVEKHKRDLIQVLRLLRDNLPRTIVNVVITPHLRFLVNEAYPGRCDFLYSFLCPCLFSRALTQERKHLFFEIMSQWQEMEKTVVSMKEFDKDDFTVIAQPFLQGLDLPLTKKRTINLTTMAPDCFHLSHKGNAEVANDLWNNIMEPAGNKTLSGRKLLEMFNCPSMEHPYIYTRRNS